MNLRHLARLAGISPSAVSLALRDSQKISEATKKKVRQLAAREGYRPDAKLVAMMTHLRKPQGVRQAACFGVISFYADAHPWETSRHLTQIYEGMKRRAGELGYRLEPLWLREPGMTYRRFRSILEARGIEGLLCFAGDRGVAVFRQPGSRAGISEGAGPLRDRHGRVEHPHAAAPRDQSFL
jgi:LacI family transcriptional regulator